MELFTAETPAGKPKIVDKNGFSIATAADGTKSSKKNISDLAFRYNAFPGMYEALEEIIKCEGAYSKDPLQHAQNVIANLTSIAEQALNKLISLRA